MKSFLKSHKTLVLLALPLLLFSCGVTIFIFILINATALYPQSASLQSPWVRLYSESDTLALTMYSRYATNDEPVDVAIWFEGEGWEIGHGEGGATAGRSLQFFKGLRLVRHVLIVDNPNGRHIISVRTGLSLDTGLAIFPNRVYN